MYELKKKYDQHLFNVVLIEPQIPNNTGNIGRLCVATNSRLHLVEPLGFEISDSRIKRAGLDYWPELEWRMYKSLEGWLSRINSEDRVYFFSAKASNSLYNLELKQNDWLVFGKEASGLGDELLERFKENLVKIPFPGKVRSFNLSNAVAMVLGEGMRQISL